MHPNNIFRFSPLYLFLLNALIFAQATNDYRSAATGNWNSLTTWQRYNGSTWVQPNAGQGTPTNSSGIITILNTHTVTVTATVSIDQAIVNSGGQITVNNGVTLTIANGTGTDLTVNGTINNSGTITPTGTISFGVVSTYQHSQNGGVIPTATWNLNSICLITGMTGTLPTNLGQSFGNLTWNCPSQTASTTPTTEYNIQGNLTIQNTNTGQFRMGTAATSINNVLGNYVQSGGTVRISGATARVLNVSGNFNLSGGTLLMSDNTTVGTLNVAGNFNHTGGTIDETSTGSGSIIFNGITNQNYTGGGIISNTINFTINNPAGITLLTSVNFPATLTMTQGNINTGTNTLSLGNSATNLGLLSRTSGTIVGNFRRWFATSTVSNILFPIGTGANYRPANISFTNAITAAGTLTVAFTSIDPGTAGLPLNDGGTSIINAGKEGYWAINAGDGLSGGTYTLDLTADGFSGVTNVSTLRLLKRSTGGNWVLQGTNSPGTGTTTTPIIHRTGLSGFSEFGVGGASDNPLPVQLSSFSASIKNGTVLLNWRTETEVNNFGFDVERNQISKINGQTEWQKIGFVQGNGNSNSPKGYSFFDDLVSAGMYSYRLKQIDNDGNFEYSKVVEISIGYPSKIELSQNFPNPFNPTTTITFSLPESGNVQLYVYNIIGEKVAELVNEFMEAGEHKIKFDASLLNNGMYIYKLETGDMSLTKKMILIK